MRDITWRWRDDDGERYAGSTYTPLGGTPRIAIDDELYEQLAGKGDIDGGPDANDYAPIGYYGMRDITDWEVVVA